MSPGDQPLERESAAYTKVSIWRRGGSYSLRARLPDKTTGKVRQQWVSIRCKATQVGLKIAQAKAAKLGLGGDDVLVVPRGKTGRRTVAPFSSLGMSRQRYGRLA